MDRDLFGRMVDMRTWSLIACALLACGLVGAETKSPNAAKSPKPTNSSKAPKPDPKASRKELRVEARNIAAEARAPVTPEELVIASRVQVGNLPCELGQTVVLAPDTTRVGTFTLRLGKETYAVSPEETTTGAIRLEDKAAGIVWLQLANKSMLMSQKFGKRLADECKSPEQILVAEAMLKNPPPSVLDAPPAVAPRPAASQPDVVLPPVQAASAAVLPPAQAASAALVPTSN